MKKAGILTLFGEYNFGNRLQNYAVQQILKKYNLNVETIKYLLKDTENAIVNNNIEASRLKKFKEFNKNITFSKDILYMDYKTPDNFGSNYDYIVIGSDQIWNYSFKSFSDKALAAFVPSQKKFSLSASFGIDYVPEKNTEIYNICQKGLNDLKAISVREEAGKEIVNKITNRNDVEVLVDPTMLIETKQWEKLIKKPENLKTDRFILKSFLGNVSENIWNELTTFAKKHNCEIIDISDKNSPFYDVGPAEFLYLEKNAFCVATDSFHSAVFAILFATPFIVFERQDKVKSMFSRIESLLSKFNMKNRIFSGKISDEILNNDFLQVDVILKQEYKKADDFLKKALS